MTPTAARSAALLIAAAWSAGAAAAPAQLLDGAVTYTVTHRFKTFSGVVPASDLEANLQFDGASPRDLLFEIAVPLGAFDSGNELRDQHAAEALELLLFPRATWIVDGVSVAEFVPQDDGTFDGQLTVRGPLTLHGVTRSIEVPVRILYDPASGGRRTLTAWASFELSLSDFDIRRPGLLGIRIEDSVPVSVELTFTWPTGGSGPGGG